jgi:hypothetical protein
MHIGHCSDVSMTIQFQRHESRRNASRIDRMIGRQTNVEKEIKGSIRGNNAHIADTDAFLLVFRGKVGKWIREPERITVFLRKKNTCIDF